MNIVLVVDQFDDGNNGTTVTARRYAHELRKLGHRVTILAGGEPAEHKICAPNHTIPFFEKLIDSQSPMTGHIMKRLRTPTSFIFTCPSVFAGGEKNWPASSMCQRLRHSMSSPKTSPPVLEWGSAKASTGFYTGGFTMFFITASGLSIAPAGSLRTSSKPMGTMRNSVSFQTGWMTYSSPILNGRSGAAPTKCCGF